jgi:phosphoribosylformylglycinamidine cyclo-ligase
MAWLSKAGGISEHEMLKTFNCGIGMILAVAQDQIAAVESVLIAHDVEPVRMGEVIKGQGVQYSGQLSF